MQFDLAPKGSKVPDTIFIISPLGYHAGMCVNKTLFLDVEMKRLRSWIKPVIITGTR